jgi:hypothetical protein
MMMARKPIFIPYIGAVLGLAIGCAGYASESHTKRSPAEWTPSVSLVEQIETKIKMPKGTALNGYSRHYYGVVQSKHRILIGVYIQTDKSPGVKISPMATVPKVFDGGCGVVNLKYDVDQGRTLAIFCNGDA